MFSSLGLIALIAIWSLALWGVGLLFSRLFLPSVEVNAFSSFSQIWIGLALYVFYLLVLNFFLPLKAAYVLPLPLAGIISGFIQAYRLQLAKPKRLKFCLWLGICLVMAYAISVLAMAQPYNYDSGLYHFNAVRWANQSPILPGLGLVHHRLAFNNSFFLFVAALNISPLYNQARSLANSLIFFIFAAFLVWQLLGFIIRSKKEESLTARWDDALVYTALTAALIHLFVTSDGFSSPTPDLTSTLLQLALFVLLFEWQKKRKSKPETALISASILLLAATMVTVKLSNALFAVMSALWVFFSEIRGTRHRKWLLPVLTTALLLGAAWIWRGYLGSGTPFFPSTLGFIEFEWAIPKQDVAIAGSWVKRWAQLPGSSPFDPHQPWDWFNPWLQKQSANLTGFTYPLGLSLVLGMLAAFLGWRNQPIRVRSGLCLLTLITVASLVFWFFTAPDLRFANGFLYLLPLSLALILVDIAAQKSSSLLRTIPYFLLILLTINYLGYSALYAKDLKLHPQGYASIPVPALEERLTKTGFRVLVPIEGDRCWDSALPCTPSFTPNLRLLGPHDGGTGFRLDH